MGGLHDDHRNAIFVSAALLRYYDSDFDDPVTRYGGLGHLLSTS